MPVVSEARSDSPSFQLVDRQSSANISAANSNIMADDDAFMRELLSGLGGSTPAPTSTTTRTWSTTSSRAHPTATQVAYTSRLPARPAPQSVSSVRTTGATVGPPASTPAAKAASRDLTPESDYGIDDDDDWAALADNYDAMVENVSCPLLNVACIVR